MKEGISSRFKFFITRGDVEIAFPYAVRIRNDVEFYEAKVWCEQNLGWPRRAVGNLRGIWTCRVQMPFMDDRVFYFVNEARAIEFKLFFG